MSNRRPLLHPSVRNTNPLPTVQKDIPVQSKPQTPNPFYDPTSNNQNANMIPRQTENKSNQQLGQQPPSNRFYTPPVNQPNNTSTNPSTNPTTQFGNNSIAKYLQYRLYIYTYM